MALFEHYLVLPLLFIPAIVFSQFNMLVAYDLSYADPAEHNLILERNNDQMFYDREINSLNFLNGLKIGGRYDLDGIAFELNFGAKLASRLGTDPAISSLADARNRLKYQFYTASFGWEGKYRALGIGASLDYNFLSTKVDFEHPDLRQTFRDRTFGHTVYLSFHFEGNGTTHLAVRPYAQFFWDSWDQGPLNALINQTEPTARPDKFTNFGISFIFLNGMR